VSHECHESRETTIDTGGTTLRTKLAWGAMMGGLLLSAGWACRETEGFTESPGGLAISVSMVSSSGDLSLRVGDSLSFSVETTFDGPYTLVWSSTDSSRLSIDQRGMVRGRSVGTAAAIVQLRNSIGREAYGRADLTILP